MSKSPRDKLLDAAKADLINEDSLAGLRLLAKANAKVRETKSLLRLSERRVEELEQVVAVFDSLADQSRKPIHISKPKRRGKRSRHLLVCLLSDTHSCEYVSPLECPLSAPDGHNAEIGEARMREYFRSVSMIFREQQATFSIDTICLALMGDLLVNKLLHPDSAVDGNMGPLDEAQICYRIVREGIESLLASTDVKHLVIPTVFGNHGRVTQKQFYSGAGGVSVEQLIYTRLAADLGSDPRIRFDIRPQIMKTVEIEGWRFLISHGDRTSGMSYAGGVGGIQVPFKKFLLRALANDPGVNCCAIGHFHTPTVVTGSPTGFVNGSLVGVTPYSQAMAGASQRPQQWAFLVDLERLEVGRTFPIWVD